MRHHRSTAPRLLGAALAVTLAVTAGGLTVPAVAAGPETANATSEQQEVFSLPPGTLALPAGPTGFLARHPEGSGYAYTWVRHDGTQTPLPGSAYAASFGTDLVVRIGDTTRTVIDMASGAEVATYDDLPPAGTYRMLRHQGASLVVVGLQDVRVLHKDAQGGTVDRKVTGLPGGAQMLGTIAVGPDAFLVQYSVTSNAVTTFSLAVVDVASASVVETYATASSTGGLSMILSATHVAWVETTGYRQARLAVARRGTSEVTRTELPEDENNHQVSLRIMGDRLVYVRIGAATRWGAGPFDRPVSVPLSNPAERTVLPLAHAALVSPAADGSLLVTGGTIDRGEGLYRISPGTDGAPPTVSQVATTGVPTVLTLVEETPPPNGTVDFDQTGGKLSATWKFSRPNTRVSLKLTHTATGRSALVKGVAPNFGTPEFGADWDGLLGTKYPAHAGAYTWTMRAEPANGIGPAVERTGSFTLTRAPRPHDYDGNGSPDVLNRSGGGVLSSYDLGQLRRLQYDEPETATRIGGGWNAYDRITATGNTGGTAAPDLVARDGAGVLWWYAGKGDGTFATRIRVGGGWNTYDTLTGGSDVTGDGRNDLLAADRTGILWLYPGTGNAAAPFAARKRVGGGWGVYNLLSATGDLGGATAGDLVARDRDGVLWLYLAKGDGTFAPRTRIGGGWNTYDEIIGVGDIDGDGRNDLASKGAIYRTSEDLYVYRGTGQWRTPFQRTEQASERYLEWPHDIY
ncbi:FG-GAP repeat domain-containing protein [Streptomyces sp. NPDC085529]|uniref:FG-GAP repeat domain-containing protein n=1 Tax=Streptomyces sp. NPDC085529 TaxID=3365729 RepID=UPI0037D9393F